MDVERRIIEVAHRIGTFEDRGVWVSINGCSFFSMYSEAGGVETSDNILFLVSPTLSIVLAS